MEKDANQIFNELVENYCLENGIDPMTLFENGRINQQAACIDPENNLISGQLDITEYPRSQEPLVYMKVYSNEELVKFVPLRYIKECEEKRNLLFDRKMRFLE